MPPTVQSYTCDRWLIYFPRWTSMKSTYPNPCGLQSWLQWSSCPLDASHRLLRVRRHVGSLKERNICWMRLNGKSLMNLWWNICWIIVNWSSEVRMIIVKKLKAIRTIDMKFRMCPLCNFALTYLLLHSTIFWFNLLFHPTILLINHMLLLHALDSIVSWPLTQEHPSWSIIMIVSWHVSPTGAPINCLRVRGSTWLMVANTEQ